MLRVTAGRTPRVRVRRAPTVDLLDAFSRYQAGRGFAPSTLRRRRYSLCALRSHVGGDLASTTPEDVEEWLRRYPSPRTRFHYRSDANVFFRWAVRRGYLPTNPVELTDPPRLPRSVPHPLHVEQLDAILALGDADQRLMAMLGAYAGLRVSEIARLHTADLFLHSHPPTLLVVAGKGGKDRVVPLHPRLAAALAVVPAGWVFPSSRRDGPLSVGWVRARIEEVFALAGVDATPHALRATMGTEVARVTGGNIMVVAALLGHEQVSTSQAYVGWSPTAACREAVAGLYGP